MSKPEGKLLLSILYLNLESRAFLQIVSHQPETGFVIFRVVKEIFV